MKILSILLLSALFLSACSAPVDEDPVADDGLTDDDYYGPAELENQTESTEDQESNSSGINQAAASDDFKYDEENAAYYGKLIVSGYATLKERPEAFCEENCPMFTYVFFEILDTENEFLDDFVERLSGNSFVGETSIGLGCVEDNILWRMNDSDEFGSQKYTNSLETSELVLNSSAENPITIELERYLPSGYDKGAPDCYSHYAQVKVVE